MGVFLRVQENRSAGLNGLKTQTPGSGERGRRRTRQDQISLRALGPDEIADQRSAPNEENLFLLPDRFSKSGLSERTIQPFDLMSRRHPLSSTRASWIGISFEKRNVLQGSCDVPASSRRQFLKRKLLLLLGDLAGLLRSLLHCALRLLRLLSFLGHDALRCSVSLRALGNRNALHPEYTNTSKKTVSALRKC
jgi:hypothetical protein